MSPMPEPESTTIETLTEAAALAASRGEWNVVEACYRRRKTLLTQPEISDAVIERVQALDREVAERARLAQAGVAALLRDAGLLRRRLRDIRQLADVPPVDVRTVARHV